MVATKYIKRYHLTISKQCSGRHPDFSQDKVPHCLQSEQETFLLSSMKQFIIVHEDRNVLPLPAISYADP